MPDGRRSRRETEREAELDRRTAEIDELEPYLGLAREIRAEVDRISAEGADAASLTEAIDAIPRRERQRAVRSVFEQLPAEAQWSVLERVFGDDELRDLLGDEHDRRADDARRAAACRAVADEARRTGAIDTRAVPDGEQLVLGLFREGDAGLALRRGPESDACARRLVLHRAADPDDEGRLRVLEDVFNPRGSFFVTRDYDEDTWRDERLAPHALVRVGSIRDDGATFEPVIYGGGRADVETRSGAVPGRLHLGYAVLGGVDVRWS